MSIGHIIGLLKSSTAIPILSITLNPADKSAGIALSNGNMTAMKGVVGVAWRSVRATQPRLSGKYYFEVVFNNFTGGFGCAGLMAATANLESYAGNDSNGIGWVTDGSYFVGASATFGFLPTSWVNGDVLCVAVDLDNERVWARKNNGTWNATSGGTNDPATNVGGIVLPTNLQNTLVYPAVSAQIVTDQSTARFTQSSFDYTVPSGFQAWEGPGQLFVSQHRAYVVTGSAQGIGVNQQRAYVVNGAVRGVAVSEQRAFVLAGSRQNGLAVHNHKAHALVGMTQNGQLAVHSHRAYVILTP